MKKYHKDKKAPHGSGHANELYYRWELDREYYDRGYDVNVRSDARGLMNLSGEYSADALAFPNRTRYIHVPRDVLVKIHGQYWIVPAADPPGQRPWNEKALKDASIGGPRLFRVRHGVGGPFQKE